MRHHCSACSYEFFDDTGGLPGASAVHCVACGASIALLLEPVDTRPRSIPFGEGRASSDVALGVFGRNQSEFPETLRQFRVGQPRQRMDSLSPMAEVERPAEQRPKQRGPFWTSFAAGLVIGLGVGGSVDLVRSRQHSAASATPAERQSCKESGPSPAAPTSASVARPLPQEVPAQHSVAPAGPTRPKPPSIADEHRFLLEQARAHQRRYQLAEAEKLFRRVLVRAPRNSEALSALGEIDLLRGTTDLAAKHFELAAQANPDYIPARVALADIQWQTGHVEEAKLAYRAIAEAFSEELYPPYVNQRGLGIAAPCEAGSRAPTQE